MAENKKNEKLDQGTSTVNTDGIDTTVSTVGVTKATTEKEVVDLNPGLARIKVSYPKDYEGDKFYREGGVYPVSQEVAEQLVAAKIATLVK